jgi:hypothetical protein
MIDMEESIIDNKHTTENDKVPKDRKVVLPGSEDICYLAVEKATQQALTILNNNAVRYTLLDLTTLRDILKKYEPVIHSIGEDVKIKVCRSGITPEEANKETLIRIAKYLKEEVEYLLRRLKEIENNMISTRIYDEFLRLFRRREIILRAFASVREAAKELYSSVGLLYEENESREYVERYERMYNEIEIK